VAGVLRVLNEQRHPVLPVQRGPYRSMGARTRLPHSVQDPS
jgi:hypothetical protein